MEEELKKDAVWACRLPEKLSAEEKETLLPGISRDDLSKYHNLSICPINREVEAKMEAISMAITKEEYGNEFFQEGTYFCSKCMTPLYASEAKFKGPCLWPSFREGIIESALHVIDVEKYNNYTCPVGELYCGKCHLFLGHRFLDGKEHGDDHERAGWRHCVLSLSIFYKDVIRRPPFGNEELTLSGESDRWEMIWSKGLQIGDRWDTGKPSPMLVKLLEDGALPKGKALTPGCGRGYAPLAFAKFGYEVTGIDISETAVKHAQDFFDSNNGSELPGSLDMQLGSFFELEGKFNVIYDYTFLCALDPEARNRWADKMRELVSEEDGELVTMIFPIRDMKGGPPYQMSMELVKSLLEPRGFKAKHLDMVPDDLCHEGREGATALGRWVVEK